MLGDYEKANYFLNICKNLKPGLIEKIINPNNEGLTFEEKLKHHIIDNNLEQCYQKKIFNLYELFILFSIFYIRNIIVGSFFFTSIIEEIVFRLALFNTISKKYNKVLGYLITAFLFYFIHQNPFTFCTCSLFLSLPCSRHVPKSARHFCRITI
nr:CPBP family intramembrane glutamic endopeptidase [Sporomusa ovata]EQB28208.1 hypothetical protein SOV_2c11310 [Sporomusa ovata DSM 2662]